MNKCDVESWTLDSLAKALNGKHEEKKKIVVPMFQRGRRWLTSQQRIFIDSLLEGYPVGTMLFYKVIEDSCETYILVDGLQRSNCIRKYLEEPTHFIDNEAVPSNVIDDIKGVLGVSADEDIIKKIIVDYLQTQHTLENIESFKPSVSIVKTYESEDLSMIEKINDIIAVFFKARREQYKRIAETYIPVVVYTGESYTLPIIFDRINSQGTPLSQYEVYAASWPNTNSKFKISNKDIVQSVIKKYQSFVDDGYEIHGYNRTSMEQNQEVNCFEYLLGLSRYLKKKFPELVLEKELPDDEVDPMAFELVDACLNDSKRINKLYENISAININEFEKALVNTIEFVTKQINTILKFKSNTRNTNRNYHSKFQIMSMISTTFKEMYGTGDYSKVSESWPAKKAILSKNLPKYYVYDIISNYWSEGGTTKIYKAAKTNRYLNDIQPESWLATIDAYFAKTMERNEQSKVASPGNEEYVILNCIYLNTFSAKEQLSESIKFDVEHIAPKDQMKKMLLIYEDLGLPISSIANLCYLPENVNRAKKAKNFYQDPEYLRKIASIGNVTESDALNIIEEKYSFTTKDDMAWMDIDYSESDFDSLRKNYVNYCKKRFEIIKQKFLDYFDIQYEIKKFDEE